MRVGLIGAGSMATALVRGWGEPVLVTDAVAERAQALAREVGGEAVRSNAELAERAEVVVLCHKPAQLQEVAGEAAGSARAVVSILGGVPLADVEAAYPERPVYRILPSIPAEVRRGVFCYAPGRLAASGPEDQVIELFDRLGSVIRLEERLIDPAMAVMSCGPAFLALVVEALGDAGVRHGLQAADATRLAVETMAGTAAVLSELELEPRELRRRVTSPGGLTARGLAALEAAGLRRAFDDAVDAVLAK